MSIPITPPFFGAFALSDHRAVGFNHRVRDFQGALGMVQAGRDRLARPRVRAHRAAAMEEGIRRTLAAR